MTASRPSRTSRSSSGPIRARNLGGNPATTTAAAAPSSSSTVAPLFPDSPAPPEKRFTISWAFLALAVIAGLALLFMRYYRLRRQGGAVTWRQIFSGSRSHQPANQTHGRTYPRSRPVGGSSSAFAENGYPLPPDMFLPTRPPRAAERGAAGETIGPGGRRDVEEDDGGMELPAYESARKTGLPAYDDHQVETVPQLGHRYPTPSSPPPSLGLPVDEAPPPPVPSEPSSSVAHEPSLPDRRTSVEEDSFSETTRAAPRPA